MKIDHLERILDEAKLEGCTEILFVDDDHVEDLTISNFIINPYSNQTATLLIELKENV